MTSPGDVPSALALLGSMYLCQPTREAVAEWLSLAKAIALPAIGGVREALGSLRLDAEQEMDDLLWDYTQLFIGPARLPCPPWESVYTSPKRLLMQEAFDSVVAFYREQGLSVGDPQVLQDHIGAELSFLAVLHEKMRDQQGDVSSYRRAAERFLAEHPRRWIPAFAADMEGAANTPLYKALARATAELLASL